MKDVILETPDLSGLFGFDLCDPVWCFGNPASQESPLMGRWLGVADVESAKCCWTFTVSSARVCDCLGTTVQCVTEEGLK